MENKRWLTHRAALTLLLITWRDSVPCSGLTVDPPEDLALVDPGYLGRLDITWSPPSSSVNMTDCSTLYQLEYFNTYRDSWTAIRTERRTYSAQFDLMKDVKVRVYTLLSGPCTNDTLLKSTTFTELIQKPPGTGVLGTEVQNFICVYKNMKHLECSWERSSKTPANSKQNLFYWHKGLQQAQECTKYLISDGVRHGCNFSGISLPDFTEINFCVNGSSPKVPLKPTYISLQIQNHVKPGTAEKVHLQTGPSMHLQLSWDGPAGRVPGHCLEWEVEHNQEGPDGKVASELIITNEMSLTLPSSRQKERSCFRVRSRVHRYCADKSFWSDWSRPTCHPEKKEVSSEPQWDMAVPVYVCIAVAIISVLVLSVCVCAMIGWRRARQLKRPDSLLSSLCDRSSVLTASEA